ncbi:MAG: hypothetical protein ABL962_07485 [Fimbriimonadaceae bacterium]
MRNIGLVLIVALAAGCQSNRYVMQDGKAIDTQTGLEAETKVKTPEAPEITAPDYSVMDISPYPDSKPTVEKFQLLNTGTPEAPQYNASWTTPDSVKEVVAHFRSQVIIDSQQEVEDGVSILGKTSMGYQARIFIKRAKKDKATRISVSVGKT